MRLLRVIVICGLSALATGCFNFNVLVRLKPDGSGTIEQTALANTASMAKFGGMLGAAPGQPGDSPLTTMSPDEWKAQAERLGARLLTVDKITAPGGFEGVKAVLAFDDITKIKLSPDLGGVSSVGGGISQGSPLQAPVSLAFVKGPPAALTVTMQDSAEPPSASAPVESTSAPGPLENPMIMALIKEMFRGARLGIAVDVDGTIVKTNADHVSGSRVTLLELDLGALLEEEAKLKQLQTLMKPGMSFAQLKPLFKDIKGVKVNDPVVTIEFK